MINHIGFIMDGNRRFASKNGFSKEKAYSVGMQQLIKFIKYQIKYGIFETTYYALSTENLKNRGKEELKIIYLLIKNFSNDESIENFFKENKIKIEIKGDIEEIEEKEKNLPIEDKLLISTLKNKFDSWNKEVETSFKFKVNICLNYGGHREILHSFKEIYKKIESGNLKIKDITEKTIKENIYFNDSIAPEILVRPGNAPRLSGFMLWDSQYSEIYLTKKYWPELIENDFIDILNFFDNQNRNFGK